MQMKSNMRMGLVITHLDMMISLTTIVKGQTSKLLRGHHLL